MEVGRTSEIIMYIKFEEDSNMKSGYCYRPMNFGNMDRIAPTI